MGWIAGRGICKIGKEELTYGGSIMAIDIGREHHGD
jgi:hypothetical protein